MVVAGVAGCALLLAAAQAAPAKSGVPHLLDHLAGRWVLTGILASKHVTHDVDARWVLNREYIQFHEVARPRMPAYEAIVYISWNEKAKQYTCLWLDSTAAAPEFQPIGRANSNGNSIPFVITVSPTDAIHTTFAYDGGKDRWRITIDDVNQGKTIRFGDVFLTRK